jgi:tetratricopeptide (TPR) repeat protein
VRRALLFAAAILCVAPVPAAAEWRSLRSEHFHLIGDVSPRQLRDVALRFEQFRDIVTRLNIASARQEAASPLTVFVFKNRTSFEPFMPRFGTRTVEAAGMFVEGPDSVYLAVRLDRGEASFRSVFHEYTHLLVRRVLPEAPLWLHEGLAEYYSTLRITGERSALIGFPVAAHHRLLQQRAMPLTQMFAATDSSPEYTGETAARLLLYAQSWALVHHAFQSKPSRSTEILELARKLAAGGAIEENVQALYGIPVAELERRVLGYIRNGSYTAVAINFRAELVNSVTANAAPISDAEADGWLGDLLGQMGRDDEARPRLENALAREPGLAQAHEALAMLLLRKDLMADAAAHLKEAQALGRNVDDVLRKTRSTAPPAGFTQTPSTGPSTPPPPGARPFLRITLADEQRSFGTLEALDCKGDQVEFVVRTADGSVRAGARFGEISVISYRQGSLGNLLCGAPTASLPTLLTWKAGAGESRRAIAVEFVPDGFTP